MNVDIHDMQGEVTGTCALPDSVFQVGPRPDIVARVVRWQRSRTQAGTHAVKLRGEIARSSKKLYGQKKTGRARHGSARAGLFRGGGRAFGPEPRSHAIRLPKRVRRDGLRHALSARAEAGNVHVVDDWSRVSGKTAEISAFLGKLGITSALIVADDETIATLRKAVGNLPRVQTLPVIGLNVLDIVRFETVILSSKALSGIEARLS